MMTKRDDILALLNEKGTLLPSEAAEALKENTIIAGALLSELVAEKKVQVSSAKIGSSPLYYLPSKRDSLQRLRPHLNEKDARLYDKLEQQKILRDTTLSPLEQASARSIHDFAIMLTATIKGKQEIFWKWHLISNQEATERIRKMLGVKQDTPKEEAKSQPRPQQQPTPRPSEPEVAMEKEAQQTLSSPGDVDDPFFTRIKSYLEEKKISVHGAEVIRAKKDIELLISIPTGIGNVRFYCRARDKKRCNDADLSVAFMQGQLRHLPTIFLTTGELTKKARTLLETDFKGITVAEKVG
jgi:hypothetical protein